MVVSRRRHGEDREVEDALMALDGVATVHDPAEALTWVRERA